MNHLSLLGRQCGNPDCTVADTGRCARASEFPEEPSRCPDLLSTAAVRSEERPALTTISSNADPAPWSGRHLNSAEINRLLFRSPARLLGVLGPYNAGKTCLLTSFFLQLASGQRGPLAYRFASSLTLHILHQLAAHSHRWQGKQEEEILNHTPAEETAHPGSFLHLGLRPDRAGDERHIDVFLSDFPGEWISEWADVDDDTSHRRLAALTRCDGFIVLADAMALMQSTGHSMDGEIAAIIERISELPQHRSVQPGLSLVFSKFDHIAAAVIPPPPQERLDRKAWGKLAPRIGRIFSALKRAQEAGLIVDVFPVSAFAHSLSQGQPIGVMEPFCHVLNQADRQARWPRPSFPVPEGARSFLSIRRWDVSP